MSSSETPLSEIRSVQQLYERLKKSSPIKGILRGREITFGDQSTTKLSDVVDTFRTLVQEGRIVEETGVENEAKYVRLCAKKIRTLNKEKGAILSPLQLYRKKEIKEIEKKLVETTASATHLSKQERLLARVSYYFYKKLPKDQVTYADAWVRMAKNFIDHPMESREETMTNIYTLLPLGYFFNTKFFSNIIIGSANELGLTEWSDPWRSRLVRASSKLGHGIEQHRLPLKPSEECVGVYKNEVTHPLPSQLIGSYFTDYEIEKYFHHLPQDQKDKLKSYLLKHISTFPELAEIERNSKKEITEKIKFFEQSLMRRIGEFETGSAKLTREEKEGLFNFFSGKTTAPPDLSRLDALWEKRIAEIDKERLYKSVRRNFPERPDQEVLSLVFFIQGKEMDPPDWIRHGKNKEIATTIIRELLADGLPPYRTMALRLEEILIDIEEIKEKVVDSLWKAKVFTKQQDKDIVDLLTQVALHLDDKALQERLQAYLLQVKQSTLLPQKKIDVLISLANDLFALHTPAEQKLAVRLAYAIPIMAPLVDIDTWRRYITIDENLMVGSEWENTLQQKVYSDKEHFKKFSPELFSALVVWGACEQGRTLPLWIVGEGHHEFDPEVKALTHNFIFYNMPGMTPFPFQGSIRFMLRYREKEIPERYRPYLAKTEW